MKHFLTSGRHFTSLSFTITLATIASLLFLSPPLLLIYQANYIYHPLPFFCILTFLPWQWIMQSCMILAELSQVVQWATCKDCGRGSITFPLHTIFPFSSFSIFHILTFTSFFISLQSIHQLTFCLSPSLATLFTLFISHLLSQGDSNKFTSFSLPPLYSHNIKRVN